MSQDYDKNNKKTKKGGDQKSKKVRIVFCYKSQKCFKEKVQLSISERFIYTPNKTKDAFKQINWNLKCKVMLDKVEVYRLYCIVQQLFISKLITQQFFTGLLYGLNEITRVKHCTQGLVPINICYQLNVTFSYNIQ